MVKIDDAQEQTYVINFPGDNDMTINEGMMAGLELEAVPDRTVNLPFNVTLSSDEDVSDYWLDENPIAISQNYTLAVSGTERVSPTGTSDGTQPFTVHASSDDMNDGDRVDDVVTVTARTTNLVGNQRTLQTFELMVTDQHKLPAIAITKLEMRNAADTAWVAATSIPEGTLGRVTLTADRSPSDVPDTEAVTVTLEHLEGHMDNTADSGDFTLGSRTVTIAGSATNNMMTGTFTVDVDEDEDINEPVNSMESLVLGADVEGSSANGPNPSTSDPHVTLAAIEFSDTTMAQISAKTYAEIDAAVTAARTAGAGANGLWEPGETLTLDAEELFDFAATMNVVLGNIVVDDPSKLSAAASNDMVTITAMGDGESPISITGTVVGPSSLEVTQTTSNVVTVKFPITVDAPAITPKDNVQAVADAAVATAAAASANGIWEPAPNGAVAMIAVSDLFDVPASINDEYLARSSDPADVSASISADMTMVELTPEGAGTATITVTAVDTDRPGNAVTIDFTATVVAQAAVRALSQTEVDAVFEAAGVGDLVAQGPAIGVDMSDLFELGSGVTPNYSAGSSADDVLTASASGTMLTLTPGDGVAGGAATVTVTALDTASGANASVEYMATVDPLAPVLTITSMPMSGSMVDEGGSITVTATLNQEASAAMSVALDVSGPASGAEEITIAMGGTSGSATLTVDDDDVVMAMPAIVIVASHAAIAGGSAVLNFSVTEDDVETTYSVTPAAVTVMEGGDGMTITATASQAVMANTEVMLMHGAGSASEDDYSLTPAMITIMEGDTTGSTMLTATDDDAVEGMEMVTLNAMIGTMSVGTVEVSIQDDDVETTYELSSSADMVEEGGEVTITATANQMVREATMIELTAVGGSADADDYSLEPMMLTIAMGETSGSVTLTATDDRDVEGTETLRLQGAVGSMIIGQVLLEIGDNDVETTYTLAASADTVEEGGTVTITATASQAVDANTEVMLMRDGASSAGEDDYSLDPPLITIMMGETSGSLTLTATDDDDVEGNENLTLNGMVGDMSAGSVMVAIADNDMDITYTLSAEEMNLVEGASAELTATASSAVRADTEVMIMRDGSSTASDADFTAESIMIMAGETTGTTMVMAVEDNEPDSGSGSPEMLTLYGMVDGMQTNSVSFYLWDAAVPALPLIAQLLLAAFLAIGGYRRYLRRR